MCQVLESPGNGGCGEDKRDMAEHSNKPAMYSLMAGTSEELGADGRKSYLGSDSPGVGRPAVV